MRAAARRIRASSSASRRSRAIWRAARTSGRTPRWPRSRSRTSTWRAPASSAPAARRRCSNGRFGRVIRRAVSRVLATADERQEAEQRAWQHLLVDCTDGAAAHRAVPRPGSAGEVGVGGGDAHRDLVRPDRERRAAAARKDDRRGLRRRPRGAVHEGRASRGVRGRGDGGARPASRANGWC